MNQPVIPQSELFKAIQEVVKAGGSVEFGASGFTGTRLTIVSYRDDTAGRVALSRACLHGELDALRGIREWLAKTQPTKQSGTQV